VSSCWSIWELFVCITGWLSLAVVTTYSQMETSTSTPFLIQGSLSRLGRADRMKIHRCTRVLCIRNMEVRQSFGVSWTIVSLAKVGIPLETSIFPHWDLSFHIPPKYYHRSRNWDWSWKEGDERGKESMLSMTKRKVSKFHFFSSFFIPLWDPSLNILSTNSAT